ncbi:hypothetical protein K469DRAFT_198443 [Zopfia rhizophila CBS 207.26]|uniref:Uncharacterized protein n=1 Tax=Zopfia rhizophila CBS 207.26 TaxID=1314779 RepID=A0A6A6E1Q6_9PEZI|nr:hypothetical protein K469DRAFT_198443 [Zopfia rhizophila CBS 207.26]
MFSGQQSLEITRLYPPVVGVDTFYTSIYEACRVNLQSASWYECYQESLKSCGSLSRDQNPPRYLHIPSYSFAQFSRSGPRSLHCSHPQSHKIDLRAAPVTQDIKKVTHPNTTLHFTIRLPLHCFIVVKFPLAMYPFLTPLRVPLGSLRRIPDLEKAAVCDLLFGVPLSVPSVPARD